MTASITPADLTLSHPVYALNLTGAQRSTLEWLTCHGAFRAPIAVDPKEVAEDCDTSVSTVYEALSRLTALRLVQQIGTTYRVNPRFYFAQNPGILQLVLDALDAPDVEPDERAHQPRRASPADAERRRTVRPVD